MAEDKEWVNFGEALGVDTIDDREVKKPRLFKVIFLNDDYTPMEYVRAVLMHHFNKTGDEAKLIALQVHNTGKGIGGVYALDIAETKSGTVNYQAREIGHPLTTKVEAE